MTIVKQWHRHTTLPPPRPPTTEVLAHLLSHAQTECSPQPPKHAPVDSHPTVLPFHRAALAAEVLALFRVLSPASPPIPLRAYSWWRLWAALLGSNALLPLLMAYTYLCPHVSGAPSGAMEGCGRGYGGVGGTTPGRGTANLKPPQHGSGPPF